MAAVSEDTTSPLFTGDLDEAALAEEAAQMAAAIADLEDALETNELDRKEEETFFEVAAKITIDADGDDDESGEAGTTSDTSAIGAIAMKVFSAPNTNVFDDEEEEFRQQVADDLKQRKEEEEKEELERQQALENDVSDEEDEEEELGVEEGALSDDDEDDVDDIDLEDEGEEEDEESSHGDPELEVAVAEEDEDIQDDMSIDDSITSDDPSMDSSASSESSDSSSSESSSSEDSSSSSSSSHSSEPAEEPTKDNNRKSQRGSNPHNSAHSLCLSEIIDKDDDGRKGTDNNDSDEVLLRNGILRVDETSNDQAFICDWDRWRNWKKRKLSNNNSQNNSNNNSMEESSQRWGHDETLKRQDSHLRMPKRRTSGSSHDGSIVSQEVMESIVQDNNAKKANDNDKNSKVNTTNNNREGFFDWTAWRQRKDGRQLSSTSRTASSSSDEDGDADVGGANFDEGSVLAKLDEWEEMEESMRSLTSIGDDYDEEGEFAFENEDLQTASDHSRSSTNKRSSQRKSSTSSLSPRRSHSKSPVNNKDKSNNTASWKKWQRDKRRSGFTNRLTKSHSEKWNDDSDDQSTSSNSNNKRRESIKRTQSERGLNSKKKPPPIPSQNKKGFRRAQSWDNSDLFAKTDIFDWKSWRKDRQRTMKKSNSDPRLSSKSHRRNSERNLSKSVHN
ncbi:expressed unknown protein [Seminavis robusta]|uniref:Uncharacterized protein n=1 Tax=Seminavis robusta TaxID=568900 RepID=A0A9N8DQU2_9STRA|nr:expressed unknown protein [Seminavis robusta]|eukprot:Sro286_g108450.1 n/a (675) ;mRNA; r:74166-76190